MKYIQRISLALCLTFLTLASQISLAAEVNTYTYLRCFYRENPSSLTPSTSYVWGRDPVSNDYYRVNGYWWSSGLLTIESMFYSKTTQTTLLSVCQSTLKKRGIAASVAMYAAADTSVSLNYMVWTIDAATQQNKNINKIISFGDSLSDTQNMFNATNWNLPSSFNYFAGRFSNGQNWLDYLSNYLNLPLYNWSVGGAAADDYFVVPGVNSQIGSWIRHMKNLPKYQPENNLFTILIGGNDLISYGRSVDSIIGSETDGINQLIKFGAKNILLVNLPDISRAPMFAFRNDGASIKAQINQFNQRLEELVSTIQKIYGKSVNIQLFDAHTYLNNLINNPQKYGFTNITQSCLDIKVNTLANYFIHLFPRSECTNADAYIFWDLLHPTSYVHKLMAESATKFIDEKFK